jgi:hypothetical protein
LPIACFRLSVGLWMISRRDSMFNGQLGQALLEVPPGEVSSSIAYQISQGTNVRESHS